MLNWFNKKNQGNYGSKNVEEYTPAYLPKNVEDGHTDLSTFITSDYLLLNEKYMEECYKACENKLLPIIETSDNFTVGESLDAYIDAEMKVVENKYEEEVAMHELSGANIIKSRNVRAEELRQRIPKLHEKITETGSKVEKLKDKHAKHALRIGNRIIQLGLPVTLIAFAADFFVNTEFVQSILFSNVNLLRILVVCLCLMSDATMFAVGTIMSQDEEGMPKWLRRTFCIVFVSLFAISIIGSIAIRVGSMSLTYGSFDASGNFIGKDTFTVAEYALAIISSLSTAVTGALSLFFSVDRDYYLEKECIKLQKTLKTDKKICSQLESELLALEQAEDPMVCDKKRRKAAEANIAALSAGLKMHVRKLLALHQQDALYTDAMAESAKVLLESMNKESTSNRNVIDGSHVNKKTVFTEEKELKEAV